MQTRPQPIELIGSSPFVRDLAHDIDCAAGSDVRVLLSGEAGCGKRFFARTVHQASARRFAPLVSMNCAGLPASLLESELFGGSRSFIEQAKGGTLLLHEIGELTPRLQALTCEFLENGEIPRLIATTSKNLVDQIPLRKFREDFYYRLNTVHVIVPSLRDRQPDIQPLLAHFIKTFADAHQTPEPRLIDETVACLQGYSWPGNVRELKMVAERLVALRADVIQPADLLKKIFRTGTAPFQDFKSVAARSSRLAVRRPTPIGHRFGSTR